MRERSPSAAKRVLVVEDDPGIRVLLEGLLRQRGYGVTLAETGQRALAAMRECEPDLVLLDLHLPDMSGWDLLGWRDQDPNLAHVPVLVVSGADAGDLQRAQQLGAPVFVSKPFDVEVLLAEVGRLCEGPVRQCAWCRRVMDEQGQFTYVSGRKLRWASHGICPRCKEVERAHLLAS